MFITKCKTKPDWTREEQATRHRCVSLGQGQVIKEVRDRGEQEVKMTETEQDVINENKTKGVHVKKVLTQ